MVNVPIKIMKIVFDAKSVGDTSKNSGVVNYARNLINELKKAEPKNDYSFYFNAFKANEVKRAEENIRRLDPKTEYRFSRIPSKLLRIFFRLFGTTLFPIEFVLGKLDVLHLLAPVVELPKTYTGKTVMTVHDLTFIKHPQYHPEVVINLVKVFPKLAQKVDFIIADSQATKNDLVAHTGVSEKKVTVVYLAADEKFRPLGKNKVLEVIEKYKLSNPYIMFVGSFEPRKNIVGLIQAFSLVKQKIKTLDLVLVGRKGWLFEPILKEIKNSPCQDSIRWLDKVGDGDLPALLNGTAVFAYPSFYEGFGLPILEAMSCGVPVVCSNSSSMPEVGGDAAYYVNPDSIEDIAKGILTVINDSKLQRQMIQRGLTRAKNFSWEKTAKETLDVYREVVKKL